VCDFKFELFVHLTLSEVICVDVCMHKYILHWVFRKLRIYNSKNYILNMCGIFCFLNCIKNSKTFLKKNEPSEVI
jgi:hypothetical protein